MLKVAVAVATEKAAPEAFVVFRGIRKSIQKAAKMGYDGIELALKTPEEIDDEEVERVLEENNMVCPAISTGQVFADLGLYFTHPSPEKREETISVFKSFIDNAERFEAMLNIGRVRGFIQPKGTFNEAKRMFLTTLKPIESYARKKDVVLVLEPVNRYETNFLNNLDQAADVLREVNSPYVKMMPDLFHMNIEDASIEGALERYKDLISYIHFADSNRHAPGMGHLDFRSIIDTLNRIGYRGWISVEILPVPNPETAASNAIRYIRKFMK